MAHSGRRGALRRSAAAQRLLSRSRGICSLRDSIWAGRWSVPGKPHQAILAYARALQDAQADGRWLNEASTPAAFAPVDTRSASQTGPVRHDRTAARASGQHLRRDSMRRVDKSCGCISTRRAAALPESGQRRASFTSGYSREPLPEQELFPWADSFEAETLDIRRELLSLLPGSDGREPVFGSAALEATICEG